MQRLIILAAFTILILPWPAFAQNAAEQVITVPEVEVRSGPSMQSYATSKLHAGDKVGVVNTKTEGWLGIKPPPGSYSWINGRHMNPDNNNFTATVNVPSTEVLIGSQLVKEMPNQRGSTLQQGTILTLLKDRRPDGHFDVMPANGPDGVYYAIVPAIDELRWIPASAVQPQFPAANYSSVPPPVSPSSTPPGTNDAALLVRAERSAAGGNIADALACYSQLAQQTSDAGVKAWASERYQSLQYRPAASNVQSNYSQNGSGWNNQAVAATTTSNVNVRPDYRHTGPGTLNRSFLTVAGGSKLWALEPDDPHQTRTYIKAGPSINLEDYVNRHVDVYGTLIYDGELRNHYLTASKVEMLSR